MGIGWKKREEDVLAVHRAQSGFEALRSERERPAVLRRIRCPRRGTHILGLELFFLAQSFRKKMFYDGTRKALKEAGAYLTEVY